MHILHIALGGCLRAPPVLYGITPDTGGHIAYVLEAAQAQAACNHVDHVSIATRRFRNEALGLIHDQAIEQISDKVTILRLGPPGAPYREKDEALASLPEIADALCHFAKQADLHFDAIHCHFSDGVFVGQALSRMSGAPVIYTPHALGIDKLMAGGTDCPALRTRIDREREALDHADGVIVSTRDEAAHQVPRYGVSLSSRSLRMIAPGVPTLPPASASHGRNFLTPYLNRPDRPLILAIARPVEKKNLAFLAETYARSEHLQERANLVILCGQHQALHPASEDARVIGRLEQIRSSYGLQTVFALPPSHTAHDVAGLYRLAAENHGVFVNPARHEPFGLTLLEAASAGLPVIATDRGGPVDIIRMLGHGLLVSPNSATALCDALLRMLDTPTLWQGFARAAQRAAPALGWEGYAHESTLFYRDLIRARISQISPLRRTVAELLPGLSGFLPDTLPITGLRGITEDRHPITLGGLPA